MSWYNSLQGCMFPASNYNLQDLYSPWRGQWGITPPPPLPHHHHYYLCEIQKIDKISYFDTRYTYLVLNYCEFSVKILDYLNPSLNSLLRRLAKVYRDCSWWVILTLLSLLVFKQLSKKKKKWVLFYTASLQGHYWTCGSFVQGHQYHSGWWWVSFNSCYKCVNLLSHLKSG